MKEIWKDIQGYEGLYQVSSYGKIKNIKRNKIKKQTINDDGYCVIKLSKKNKKKVFLVHRIVAETFLNCNDFKYIDGEYIDEFNKKKLVINHKDENKINNNADNLEWCTNKYNIRYSLRKRKRKRSSIKIRLYNYMIENNMNDETIEIIMNFFKKRKESIK